MSSSWLKQDNVKIVGGVATILCVPLCHVVISFMWLLEFQLTLLHTGKYSFTVTTCLASCIVIGQSFVSCDGYLRALLKVLSLSVSNKY